VPIYAFEEILPQLARSVFVAPGVRCIGRVTIGEESSIWYNAVLRGDADEIVIGRRTNIQDNCTIHVDPGFPTTIGDEVTVGHNAVVHGCTVESRVLVGMNAVLLSGCRIGSGSIIGANALVTEGKVIPPRSLVLGTPGKIVREVTDEEVAAILRSAAGYVERAAAHARSLGTGSRSPAPG